jgi:hypothetical protein
MARLLRLFLHLSRYVRSMGVASCQENVGITRKEGTFKMRNRDLGRRQFLRGSTAAVAGVMLIPPAQFGTALIPQGQSGTVRPPARSAVRTGITGATVAPGVYGVTDWLQGAKIFDSYIGLPLAVTVQKIFLLEGQFYTDPLPSHITSLASAGCQFIICVYPSRTKDDSAKLAAFLRLLNSKGIVYQAALVNEWNCANKFADARAYLDYWAHYAPVVKAAGVRVSSMVCASSEPAAYAKIQPGFPTNPLPDAYWIDYYATGYRFNVRLDRAGGLLDQAQSHGVKAGIAEFGWSAGGNVTMNTWNEYCPYLAHLAPRLPLGCVYWGCRGHDIVKGPDDPKVPGILQVVSSQSR